MSTVLCVTTSWLKASFHLSFTSGLHCTSVSEQNTWVHNLTHCWNVFNYYFTWAWYHLVARTRHQSSSSWFKYKCYYWRKQPSLQNEPLSLHVCAEHKYIGCDHYIEIMSTFLRCAKWISIQLFFKSTTAQSSKAAQTACLILCSNNTQTRWDAALLIQLHSWGLLVLIHNTKPNSYWA